MAMVMAMVKAVAFAMAIAMATGVAMPMAMALALGMRIVRSKSPNTSHTDLQNTLSQPNIPAYSLQTERDIGKHLA